MWGFHMTISKKLFLIATIGLGLGSFNASAYDVVGLKDEVQLISAFANKYDTVEYNGQTIYLGYWLNNKINSTWMTSNSKIIEIASLIKQNNDEELLKLIEQEKRTNQTIGIIAGSVVAAAYVLLIIEIIKRDISFPLELEILHSKIETLVALDKMQQQINNQAKWFWQRS
jgi:hypothetical protein